MRHVIRRFMFYICAIWVAITLDFFIPRLAPGDPVAALVGKMSTKGYITPQMQQTLSAEFGLNTSDPLWLQYLKYLNNLLHGNLGNSIQYFPTPVATIIGQRGQPQARRSCPTPACRWFTLCGFNPVCTPPSTPCTPSRWTPTAAVCCWT